MTADPEAVDTLELHKLQLAARGAGGFIQESVSEASHESFEVAEGK
jgi:hypothetical protein